MAMSGSRRRETIVFRSRKGRTGSASQVGRQVNFLILILILIFIRFRFRGNPARIVWLTLSPNWASLALLWAIWAEEIFALSRAIGSWIDESANREANGMRIKIKIMIMIKSNTPLYLNPAARSAASRVRPPSNSMMAARSSRRSKPGRRSSTDRLSNPSSRSQNSLRSIPR